MKAPPNSRNNARTKPFQPAIGTEFPVSEVPAIEAKTRGFLARGLTVFVGAAVAVTGVLGLVSGNFVPLQAVWAVGGPILGGIVAYYFGPQRKETG